MRNGIEKLHIAVFLALCVLFTFHTVSAKAADTGATYQVNGEDATLTNGILTYVLSASAPISEFVAERFSPFRVVMDINKADFTFVPAPLPANDFVKMAVEELKGDNAPGKRFIFTLKASHNYEVISQRNDVKIVFKPVKNDAVSAAPQNKKDSKLDKLISSSEKKVSGSPSAVLAERTSARVAALGGDGFGNAGYEAQRITVDFYKVDIHNVFRLLRTITDFNIIVDEHVQGSLTLALNDVPWDFALDIILNLMDLKKEERFNTIVIYPAANTFTWPGTSSSTANTLSIKPDLDIIMEQENKLIIEDNNQQSAGILKAKQLLQQVQLLETQDNIEDAIVLLDEAARLWPTNTKITDRLAAICLVSLHQNAQAAHYADISLKQNPRNYSAALYAAIANANMKRLSLANEYFIRSISGNPPMKEALLSYAAFSENNGMNEAALKLLKKYKKYYGENLSTMIASARILDKQGKTTEASAEYRSILASGYHFPPDLRHYIQARLSEK
ncbi:hypothetical protein JWG39_07545 [Desulforhopalus vacuolatus]|uniref:hypothetical protein n=1 Tax=Desulforhopalus vacuolatus TaxID=40414 RepID=UPI001965FD71|nr:hypothetical protein [Desulforhopalus vacuolatus]MBM9519674.1 hypothetical protein [Desulforhopalus vacuolatus]